MKISFEVPGIPVAKGRPRFRRFGKFVSTYTPAKTAAAEKEFVEYVKKYKPQNPIAEPVHLDVTFFMPVPKSMPKKTAKILMQIKKSPHTKKPDLDNLVKLVKDALNGIFWIDDSQIFSMNVSKVYRENPATAVDISTYIEKEED